MAKLSIAEYGGLVQTHGGVAPYPNEPPLATQAITYTTAESSAAFGANTKLVRLISDGLAFLTFGDPAGAATNNDQRLPADVIEFKGVEPGDTLSVYDGIS